VTDRQYPGRPFLGVGAILFSEDLGRVLLIQRGAPPAQGQWTFPGGLVEAGETARRACSREIEEETGLIVRLQDVAFVAERILYDTVGQVEYHYLILDFWGQGPDAMPRPRSDVLAARWVPLEEVAGLDTTRGVPLAMARALRLARGEMPDLPIFHE
jgi:8-oxo-dGTP diphosphatase